MRWAEMSRQWNRFTYFVYLFLFRKCQMVVNVLLVRRACIDVRPTKITCVAQTVERIWIGEWSLRFASQTNLIVSLVSIQMHVACASMSCWCGRCDAGPRWTVCEYQRHSRIVSGRLQQCPERWTDLWLRWQCVQFNVRNEIDDLRSRRRTHESKELSKHPNVSWIMLACGASHMRFRWSHLCECMQNAFDKLRQTCVRSTDVLLHDSAATYWHRKQLRGPCTRLPNRLCKGSETVGVRQRWLHLQLNVRTQDAQLWVSRAENKKNDCEIVVVKYLFSIKITLSLLHLTAQHPKASHTKCADGTMQITFVAMQKNCVMQ